MQAIFLLPQQTKEARNIGQSDIQRTQSEQKRGRTLLPETKAKSSEALKGKPRKPHSPETRARLSEAHKGRQVSPETRAKMSQALTGKPRKPHSPATRARMSEAQQRRWSERRKHQPEQLLIQVRLHQMRQELERTPDAIGAEREREDARGA
jgi:NUMOD3 motif